jgi:hypothetical protein
MKFKIEIDVENAAYEESITEELERNLVNIAEKFKDGLLEGMVRDFNGNIVGHYGFYK